MLYEIMKYFWVAYPDFHAQFHLYNNLLSWLLLN